MLASATGDARERSRRGSGTERTERRALRSAERAERKEAKWRRHAAYELGRREALAEAARQCADQGRVTAALAFARPGEAIVVDWRDSPLYKDPRARRVYVNGYNSCLRAHGRDPRYRDDLPASAPAMPPIEEELPAATEAEKAYLDAHNRDLWDDGARRCEQDLKGR